MEWRSKLKTTLTKTKKATKNSKEKGEVYEREAERFLVSKGLKTMTRNYACKHGELDLVMRDSESIVFVEVRFRKHTDFGGASSSVTASKQKKVRRSAEYYLLSNKLYEKFPVRFDVIAISPTNHEWIKGAF